MTSVVSNWLLLTRFAPSKCKLENHVRDHGRHPQTASGTSPADVKDIFIAAYTLAKTNDKADERRQCALLHSTFLLT
jgi:hypothetical protein